jgi:hypothetical protein
MPSRCNVVGSICRQGELSGRHKIFVVLTTLIASVFYKRFVQRALAPCFAARLCVPSQPNVHAARTVCSMPLREYLIPEFVSAPTSSKEEPNASDLTNLFEAEDIQMLLSREGLALQNIDAAKRLSLIAMLEQEIERLEPIVNTQSLSDTVRKIALANR